MRKLSLQTKVWVDDLYAKPNLWEKLSNDHKRKLNLLRKIGESNEISAIPYIAPFLAFNDSNVNNLASNVILGLISRCTPEDYVSLDEHIRGIWEYSQHNIRVDWYKISPLYLRDMKQNNALLFIASMHGNGYVREEAVKQMSLLVQDGSEMPFLLLRLNDWVSQVRYQSFKAIKSRLTPEYAKHFIANIALVNRLSICGRDIFQSLRQSILDLIKSPECYTVLLEGLESQDRSVYRFCFQFLLISKSGSDRFILEKALLHKDPVIRINAAQLICSHSELSDHMALILRDSYAPIRRMALTSIADKDLISAEPILLNALLDPYRSNREVAQYYLSQFGTYDFSEFYLDYIWGAEPRYLYIAITALGQLGQTEVAEVIATFHNHPVIRVRKAAIHGISHLAAKTYFNDLLSALLDESSGISYEASLGLGKVPYLIDEKKILDILKNTKFSHIKKHAIRLFKDLNKWLQLSCLLQSLGLVDEGVVKVQLTKQINNWIVTFNRRVHSKPIEFTTSRLLKELHDVEYLLDDLMVKKLRFLIS